METSRRCVRSIANGELRSTPSQVHTSFYNHLPLGSLTRIETPTYQDELLPNTFIIITRLQININNIRCHDLFFRFDKNFVHVVTIHIDFSLSMSQGFFTSAMT